MRLFLLLFLDRVLYVPCVGGSASVKTMVPWVVFYVVTFCVVEQSVLSCAAEGNLCNGAEQRHVTATGKRDCCVHSASLRYSYSTMSIRTGGGS